MGVYLDSYALYIDCLVMLVSFHSLDLILNLCMLLTSKAIKLTA